MLPVLAGSLLGRTGRPGDRFWRSFWCLFPSKMRSKIYPEIEPQKNMNKHEKSIEKTMRKTMNNPYMFHEKKYAKYVNALFFPYRSSISSKSFSLNNLLFIENSIQNHVRKVDVRSIDKSLKNAKMEPKSFQNL